MTEIYVMIDEDNSNFVLEIKHNNEYQRIEATTKDSFLEKLMQIIAQSFIKEEVKQ
ncbi:MAG TPA: hypothetical protein PK390_06710 [Fervidobacterium nodosum]|nr:hypothetical protein [Fervidobacterium nodosum]